MSDAVAAVKRAAPADSDPAYALGASPRGAASGGSISAGGASAVPMGSRACSGDSGRGAAKELDSPLASLLHITQRDAVDLLEAVGVLKPPLAVATLRRVVTEGTVVVADVQRACRLVDCPALLLALQRVVAFRTRCAEAEAPVTAAALDSVSSIIAAE